MTKDPITVNASSKIREAVLILQGMEIRHLPVVDDDGDLVGVLSDRDLRALAVPFITGDEHISTIQTGLESPVSTLMSSDVLSVEPEADAAEIIDLMLDNKIGAVPVVDSERNLVGIVSYMDILRELELPER